MMAVLTSSAQLNDDFVVGIALSLRVVVGLGGCAFVVVECERSANCDVMTMSLVLSRAFATHSTPFFLALSSSLPPFSLSFPSSFLSSLHLSLSSPSLDPSKSTRSYLVAVGAQLARFASQAVRCDLTAVNVMWMWSGNIPGLSQHHLSSISWSFASCSSLLLFVAMASFMAQLITVHCVSQLSISKCWPGWP